MASIKFSGIGVTEMRGSVGGTVFTRNAAGAIAKIRTVPVYPATTKQVTQAATFATVAAAWKSLTEAQALTWIVAAAGTDWTYVNRLGETRNYSGFGLFAKLNNSAYVESYPITSAPTKPAMAGPTISSISAVVTAGVLALDVTHTTGTIQAESSMIFSATPSLSAGIYRPSLHLFRELERVTAASFASPTDIHTSYVATFSLPTVGSKIFIQTTLLDDASGARLLLSRQSGMVTAGV